MKKPFFAIMLILAMMLSGCANQVDSSTHDSTAASGNSDSTDSDAAKTATSSEMFSDRDFEVGYDESESAIIELKGNSALCSSDAVAIADNTVTITDEGTYILSGTLDDGMIIVNAEKTDKIQIVLDNVTINSETGAPIYIRQADKVFITMAADSTNRLSNGGTFKALDDNNIDSVIYAKEDLTLNGSGTMIVTSPAGHGIVSKDSLKITGGAYDINCSSQAVCGKDDVCLVNADFTIVSGKDGIHAENTDDTESGFVYIQSGSFNISAEGDGISSSSYTRIEDGSFDITSGGGSENGTSKSSDSWGGFKGGGRHQDGNMPPMYNKMSVTASETTTEDESDSTSMKGIKAAADLTVNGGVFKINSADDSVHSDSSVIVSGGTFDIKSGDDGLHADAALTISGGTINITESYEGLESQNIVISGGDITLTASDDGINAAGGTDSSGNGGRDAMFGRGGASSSSNGTITISGGTINVTAYGDGMDANGSFEITGGNITISGPTQGDTATLDYDVSGKISGGTFIGTGASGMAQTFSDSEQGVLSLIAGNQSAGTEITLKDSSGKIMLTYTPALDFAVVILSTPDIIKGETYTITVGSDSAEYTAD